MCGICGMLALNGQRPNSDVLERMTDTLRHRGPDDGGILLNGPCGLGNRRLAIIDLSQAGHMPMSVPEHNCHITYNGEAYNFRQARSALEQNGHRFFSGTDTETILRAYVSYGPNSFIHHFSGMFALAIWDETARRLILARDRLGQKPLYYAQTSEWLVFGSEIKSILAHPDVPKRLNSGAVPYYLAYGYPPGPDTLFEGIRAVPPGNMLCIQLGDGPPQIELKPYWQPPFPDAPNDLRSEAEIVTALQQLLRQAVEERMIADVPLGAFLSGGLDSAAIVALMAEASEQPVKTFSIGFSGESSFDETQYAQRVADLIGTEHVAFRVEPNVIDLVEMLVEHHDQPFGDSSAIPTYLVSKLAREHVTVALTGDGGDELFAGYERFYAAKLLRRYQRLPSLVRGLIGSVVDVLPAGGTGYSSIGKRAQRFVRASELPIAQAYLDWVRYISAQHITALMEHSHEADIIAHYTLSVDARVSERVLPYLLDLNIRTYLPEDLLVKVDRCSMATSLEARSPFLDHQLVEFAMGIRPELKLKGRTTKYILKQATRGLLPDDIIDRRKHGFGVPVGYWFRNDLRDYVRSVLLASDAAHRAVLNQEVVKAMVMEHEQGFADLGQALWTLTTLELWLKKHF